MANFRTKDHGIMTNGPHWHISWNTRTKVTWKYFKDQNETLWIFQGPKNKLACLTDDNTVIIIFLPSTLSLLLSNELDPFLV